MLLLRFLIIISLSCSSAVSSVINRNNPLTKRDSPSPDDPAFIDTILEIVNPIRKDHAARNLSWDSTLASFALQKSNGCRLDHAGPYGENIYWSWFDPPTFEPDFAEEARFAFEVWTSQEEVEAYQSGDLQGGSHFTQTVWKATTKIGCAFSTERCVDHPDQEWWFYCTFYPRGNLVGAYAGNVTVRT
ncbi:CAP domain-containing protein [Podospora australis]|uniref:CAP domain-containing protein n=1 Tax=Podospora australis TaxID=1536484 RepID=A0AAN6WUL5_9PEZI|nr:CAP domain-containing protein [Podospora australis]